MKEVYSTSQETTQLLQQSIDELLLNSLFKYSLIRVLVCRLPWEFNNLFNFKMCKTWLTSYRDTVSKGVESLK